MLSRVFQYVCELGREGVGELFVAIDRRELRSEQAVTINRNV